MDKEIREGPEEEREIPIRWKVGSDPTGKAAVQELRTGRICLTNLPRNGLKGGYFTGHGPSKQKGEEKPAIVMTLRSKAPERHTEK